MSIFTDEEYKELIVYLERAAEPYPETNAMDELESIDGMNEIYDIDHKGTDQLFLKMLEMQGQEVVAVNLDSKLHFAEPWAACDESLVDLPENDAGITYNKAFLVPLEVKNES